MHYQERQQNLLNKPEVLALFKQEPRRARNRTHTANPQGVRQAETAIKTFYNTSTAASNRARENLKHQDNLGKRLEARKRATSQRPVKNKPPHLDQYHSQVESLMERHVEEKLKAINEIKAKFRAETESVKEMASGAMLDMLVDQLDKRMQQEIEEATAALNTKRQQEIEALKHALA